jgi:hypothetical protein
VPKDDLQCETNQPQEHTDELLLDNLTFSTLILLFLLAPLVIQLLSGKVNQVYDVLVGHYVEEPSIFVSD